MKLFSQKDPVQAELEKMKKQEGRFLEKNRERKELFLNRFYRTRFPTGFRERWRRLLQEPFP